MNTTIPMPARHWWIRIGLPLLVVSVAAAVLLIVSWSALVPATEVDAIAVVIRTVQTDAPLPSESTTGRVIQAPGWVEADPFSVYAGALTEGVVEDMLVLEGDHVSAGQPVARLVADDAKIGVQAATASLEVALQQAANATATLAMIDPEVAAAQAARRSLVDEHTRKQALLDDGAFAQGPVTRLGIGIESADADIAQLEARRQLLESQVRSAKAGIAVARATLAQAELALARTTISSPIDGIVIERLTSPGSVIRFGNGEHSSHIVHLYDPAHMQVRADVPLTDASSVGVGHPAEIIVDVLPDHIFSGSVTRFVHRADIQKNTVEVKVHIDDPSELLKPDMLARVRILQPQAIQGAKTMRSVSRVFIPSSALMADGSVLVIEDWNRGRGRAARQSVSLGDIVIDGWHEVIDGLSPGDRVLTAPTPQLDGQAVHATATEGN